MGDYSWSFAAANNITSLEVESDFITVINFIKKGHHPSRLCAPFVDDIAVLASWIQNISWFHSFVEANFVADNLAKKGHDLPLDIHIFEAAPLDIAILLRRDLSGILILRGSS
ncbi:hypothetical protein Ahy_B10g106557 [Arachis hypogaea]|uniref:RNase H type-1 domain-containing protein n=1 Tax=Arachis hypogaea TaxID=3818 RepID=A0A444XB68_ARAHY|nr:hypothetical protein Ahy_B10g106557 [Arachis hypogaea]